MPKHPPPRQPGGVAAPSWQKAKVGRINPEERVPSRVTNEIVRPAAGSILCRGPRFIIIDDESKSRHRAARERRFGEMAGSRRRRSVRGIGGGTRGAGGSARSRGFGTVLLSAWAWLEPSKGVAPRPKPVSCLKTQHDGFASTVNSAHTPRRTPSSSQLYFGHSAPFSSPPFFLLHSPSFGARGAAHSWRTAHEFGMNGFSCKPAHAVPSYGYGARVVAR